MKKYRLSICVKDSSEPLVFTMKEAALNTFRKWYEDTNLLEQEKPTMGIINEDGSTYIMKAYNIRYYAFKEIET